MAELAVQTPEVYRSRADSVQLHQPFLGLDPEAFRALAATVLVCIPHRPTEGVNSKLFRNAGIWGILGTPTADVSDEFTGFIEMTRAGMVRQFLAYARDHPQVEYIVMIDNDEAVEWDAPYRLIQWGKDVVSGIVCSHSEKKGGTFACITAQDEHGIARWPTIKRTHRIPAQGLRRIHSCGAGLLAVHKRVFQRMFDEGINPFMIPEETRKHCCSTGQLLQGEDMAFAQYCRELGFDLWVDFSVRAKHYKTVEIGWPEQPYKPSVNGQPPVPGIDADLLASEWTVSSEDFTI